MTSDSLYDEDFCLTNLSSDESRKTHSNQECKRKAKSAPGNCHRRTFSLSAPFGAPNQYLQASAIELDLPCNEGDNQSYQNLKYLRNNPSNEIHKDITKEVDDCSVGETNYNTYRCPNADFKVIDQHFEVNHKECHNSDSIVEYEDNFLPETDVDVANDQDDDDGNHFYLNNEETSSKSLVMCKNLDKINDVIQGFVEDVKDVHDLLPLNLLDVDQRIKQINTFRSTIQDYQACFTPYHPGLPTLRTIEVPPKRRCIRYEFLDKTNYKQFEDKYIDLESMVLLAPLSSIPTIPQANPNFKKSISDSCLHQLSISIGTNTIAPNDDSINQTCTLNTHAQMSTKYTEVDNSPTITCCSLSSLSNATSKSSPTSSPVISPLVSKKSFTYQWLPLEVTPKLVTFIEDEDDNHQHEEIEENKDEEDDNSWLTFEGNKPFNTSTVPELNLSDDVDEHSVVDQLPSGSIHSSCLRLQLPPDTDSEVNCISVCRESSLTKSSVVSGGRTYKVASGRLKSPGFCKFEDEEPETSKTTTSFMSSLKRVINKFRKQQNTKVEIIFNQKSPEKTPRSLRGHIKQNLKKGRINRVNAENNDRDIELTYFPSEEVLKEINYSDYLLKTEKSSNMSLDEVMYTLKGLIQPIGDSNRLDFDCKSGKVEETDEDVQKIIKVQEYQAYYDTLPSPSPNTFRVEGDKKELNRNSKEETSHTKLTEINEFKSCWDKIGVVERQSLRLDELKTKLRLSGCRIAPGNDNNDENAINIVNNEAKSRNTSTSNTKLDGVTGCGLTSNVFLVKPSRRREQNVTTKFYNVEDEESAQSAEYESLYELQKLQKQSDSWLDCSDGDKINDKDESVGVSARGDEEKEGISFRNLNLPGSIHLECEHRNKTANEINNENNEQIDLDLEEEEEAEDGAGRKVKCCTFKFWNRILFNKTPPRKKKFRI